MPKNATKYFKKMLGFSKLILPSGPLPDISRSSNCFFLGWKEVINVKRVKFIFWSADVCFITKCLYILKTLLWKKHKLQRMLVSSSFLFKYVLRFLQGTPDYVVRIQEFEDKLRFQKNIKLSLKLFFRFHRQTDLHT